MEIKVRNAAQAIDVALAYLRKQNIPDVPDAGLNWQERTLYSAGIEDYAITSKLFTAGDWAVEVYQGVAPVSSTVYQLAVFNTRLRRYWKGNVQADGKLTEVNPPKTLSEEESRKVSEEISRKTKIPPPRPGGYGH